MSEVLISLINPLMAGIFGAIFFGLWLRDRSRMPVLCFSISHFLLAAGFLTFQFAADPEAVSWVMTMHVFYSVGAGFICWGVAKRVGQDLNIKLVAAIFVISSAIMIAASFGENMNARLMAANTAYGLVFALTAQLLGRAGSRTLIDTVVFWFIVIAAFQFFVRPQIAIIAGGAMSAGEYRESGFYAIWVLWMGSKALLQALALVAAVVLDHWRDEKAKSEVDPLSGLKMRSSFESEAMGMLDENVDRRTSVCMIVADIDHFKKVNDVWGHQAGDEAIAAFGRMVAGTVRSTDLCGRVGGEEFCILVNDCELGPATNLANRLRRNFEALEHEALGPDIRLTASFGVAEWRHGEGYGRLFARADKSLYDAKNNGRNRVETQEESTVVSPATTLAGPAGKADAVQAA